MRAAPGLPEDGMGWGARSRPVERPASPTEQRLCHPVNDRAARAEREAHVWLVFPPGWPVCLALPLGKEPAPGSWKVLDKDVPSQGGPTEERISQGCLLP